MTDTQRANAIVAEMMRTDAMSQWLGIEVLDVQPGHCELRMKVREDMVNGMKVAHGGITYSFSDSSLAFAANGRGFRAVSIETSISHTRRVDVGDILTVKTIEKSRSRQIGQYHAEVRNQNNTVVALFQGTVFITDVEWPPLEE